MPSSHHSPLSARSRAPASWVKFDRKCTEGPCWDQNWEGSVSCTWWYSGLLHIAHAKASSLDNVERGARKKKEHVSKESVKTVTSG